MSRQPNQNAGQKADAFSETFRMAKEAEDLRLAKEKADNVAFAREMHNGFTKGGSKGSGSIRGRGSRGRPAASSAAPHHVKTPTKVAQEFTTSAYTSRKGVNGNFPGPGGFSPDAGGVFSSDNRQRETQRFVSQQDQRVGNHQVAGSHQQEKQYPMSYQPQQAATHQVAGVQQQDNPRPMGHQTPQFVNNQATGFQQQEDPRLMGHQTVQTVKNQVTDVQQKENERLMDHQTQQAATHQVAGVQKQNNQRLMDPLQPIDNQVVNHHAEAMSTGNDVEMVDAEAYTGSRKTGMDPRVTKHGTMKDSRWADAEKQNMFASTAYVPTKSNRGFKGMTSTSTQRFADDEDPERWVPTFVYEPTPMPSHLVQQSQTTGSPTSNGAAVTRRVNSAPRVQGTASSAGSRPPTGPRGGLADSQWA